jgi:cyclic peptide transporter
MHLIRILSRFKFYFIVGGICGLISSLLFTGLLMMINHIIARSSYYISFYYDSLLFVALLLTSFMFSQFFQAFLTRATHNLIFEFEIDFLQKLRQTSYQDLEKIGKERAYNALTDTRTIGTAPALFVGLFNAVIVIICCLTYTFTISFFSGLLIAVLMSLMFMIYIFRNKGLTKKLNRIRDIQNDFYRYLFDLLDGFKIIKMCRERNNVMFHEYIETNRVENRDLTISTNIKNQNNELSGSFFWYILIGLIIYVFPSALQVNKEDVNSLVFSIFYMFGPISVVIGFIFNYSQIRIAFQRIAAVQKELDLVPIQPSRFETAGSAIHNESFRSLLCENMKYDYVDKRQTKSFSFGPVSLEIKKGEVVFVTGGNGSGKSTFLNLITGMYRPDTGALFFNDEKITAEKQTWYTNKMDAVFCGTCLLTENYDKYDLSGPTFLYYANLLKMKDAINIDNKRNRVIRAFSSGQEKRMALINCLMGNKEILVLDEWAAEQDPEFREYFYYRIIPALKAKGKTIIAVTHDDEYFHCADRVLKFGFGRLLSDTIVNSERAPKSI